MNFKQLAVMESFTRPEYYEAYCEKNGERSSDALDYALRKAIADGSVVHIGRNKYAFRTEKRLYRHSYSPKASRIAREIQKEYPGVDFQIFELTQLNSFVNHQIAHNTIFISVEKDVVDYLFDTLHKNYPGQVLLKPSVGMYYRYLVDDQVVITKLPSESPKGLDEPWQSRLEKILVDITVDKLLSQMVSQSEYGTIFSEANRRYLLDVNTMVRYANRKGAGAKFREYLDIYMPAYKTLRTEGTV
jgi:hypothetical protein